MERLFVIVEIYLQGNSIETHPKYRTYFNEYLIPTVNNFMMDPSLLSLSAIQMSYSKQLQPSIIVQM